MTLESSFYQTSYPRLSADKFIIKYTLLSCRRYKKVKKVYCSLCYKHCTIWDNAVTCHRAEEATPNFIPAVIGRFSIYPSIQDDRLSKQEPMQANNLPRVATEVPATPGVSWLSRCHAKYVPVPDNSQYEICATCELIKANPNPTTNPNPNLNYRNIT